MISRFGRFVNSNRVTQFVTFVDADSLPVRRRSADSIGGLRCGRGVALGSLLFFRHGTLLSVAGEQSPQAWAATWLGRDAPRAGNELARGRGRSEEPRV